MPPERTAFLIFHKTVWPIFEIFYEWDQTVCIFLHETSSLSLHIAVSWLLCQYITLHLSIHCWWAFGSFQLFAITNNVTTNISLARPLVKALMLVFYGLGWVLVLQMGSKPEGVPGADFLQCLEQGHSPEPVYTCAVTTTPNVSGSLPASFQLPLC